MPAGLTFQDHPTLPSIVDLVAYWQAKCAGRPMPRRADLDPVEIPTHLPDVLLIDVLGGGADFRYRLVGTRIVQGMGRDATGRRVNELHREQPDVLSTLHSIYGLPVREKRPVFTQGRIFWLPTRDIRNYEDAFLPLSEDGASVNMLLGITIVTWANAAPA
jgi:hypothetical protein